VRLLPGILFSLLLRKLGLNLHITLNMAFERGPPILQRILTSALCPGSQLHKIGVKPLFLHLVQLLSPFGRAPSTLHAIQYLLGLHYPRLRRLLCSSFSMFFEAWEGVCERLEICDELFVGAPSLLGLGAGLLDLGDEGGMSDFLLVAL
jgi:hypothetical protein